MTTDAEITIIFDMVTKSVVVSWRDRIKLLYGPFDTRAKALAEAQKFIRQAGWQSDTNASGSR